MASEIDDPFEGKKLENIDEPEWGKKAKGKGKGASKLFVDEIQSDRTGRRGMSKVRAVGKTGKKGIQQALRAAPRIAGRLAGPAGLAIAAHDIYTGVQDPDFILGMTRLLGGEEAAYNMWAEEEAKEGRERPSYEEQLEAHQARLEEEDAPPPLEDTEMPVPEKRLEASRRALAPRYSEELKADED